MTPEVSRGDFPVTSSIHNGQDTDYGYALSELKSEDRGEK